MRIYWNIRRVTHATSGCRRLFGACIMMPRKRVAAFLIMVIAGMFTVILLSTVKARLLQEDLMERKLTGMQSHLQFLQSLYQNRQEDVINYQNKKEEKDEQLTQAGTQEDIPSTVIPLLNNMTGTKASSGFKNLHPLRVPFTYQLLPHLMNSPNSLRPAYHMHSGRGYVEVVVGIPTVKRDKESYLITTLSHLVDGMTEEDLKTCLIVVMVGETDPEFVLKTARQIEIKFPQKVEDGLIEVISPSPGFYPDMDSIPLTLGDSKKRVQWRTKQNLDAIFLMAYAQTKGVYYLMLEDDVIAKKHYMQEIKEFAASTTISTPDWFFLEFCHVGGIGKLFKSSRLVHFITYVQLFYYNMPIDWLLESYLADVVCSIDKTSNTCGKNKLAIRPKYKGSLFQHIGLYSSLKGKIQKVKDLQFGPVPTYYPHTNPPLSSLRTDIEEKNDHTLKMAYEGRSFFWGVKPKKGDIVEFCLEKPTVLLRYMFRSGNVEHVSDKFYETVIEVLTANGNYTNVGSFDEFGIADGYVKKEIGPVSAIRLRVLMDSTYWVILSEIELKPADSKR